jgi:hypothetical protein
MTTGRLYVSFFLDLLRLFCNTASAQMELLLTVPPTLQVAADEVIE